MQQAWIACKALLFFTLLLGFAYPLAITGMAQLLFPKQANGSLLAAKEKVVGAYYIGQQFTSDKYFWGRPSTSNYQTLPSQGSNLSLDSSKLFQAVAERRQRLLKAHALPEDTPLPADLLFSSASGLDPHISKEAALLQVARIAAKRNLPSQKLTQLIENHIDEKIGKIFQKRYVNVLQLNLALDTFEENKS